MVSSVAHLHLLCKAKCAGSPADEEGSEEADSEEPLLVRLGEDDRGSVGSEDTTDCDSDTEAAIAGVEVAVGAAGEGGATLSPGTKPMPKFVIPASLRDSLCILIVSHSVISSVIATPYLAM